MNPLTDLSPAARKPQPSQGTIEGANWAAIDRAYLIAAFEANAIAFREWGTTFPQPAPSEPEPPTKK